MSAPIATPSTPASRRSLTPVAGWPGSSGSSARSPRASSFNQITVRGGHGLRGAVISAVDGRTGAGAERGGGRNRASRKGKKGVRAAQRLGGGRSEEHTSELQSPVHL